MRLTIYLIGVIVAYLIYRHDYIHNEKEWTIKNLVTTLLCSVFSWLAVLFSLFYDLHKNKIFQKVWNKKLPPWI